MHTQKPYEDYGLCRDMLETPRIVRAFDATRMKKAAARIAGKKGLLLTGEGSSRIFPAKHAITNARRNGWPLLLHTEAGKQSQEYALADWAVLAASNSGRTAEVIQLCTQLRDADHDAIVSLCAFADSKLESLAHDGYVLQCGQENAVAATKSVLEQGLFVQALLEHVAGCPTLTDHLPALADAMQAALTVEIDPALIDKLAAASMICFAGRNDGVAEELTLKTNEITRKKADFFEGTYAAHGVEEVLDSSDVVIVLEPFADQQEKFEQVLVKGVGLTVIAIASRPTRFPTIAIQDAGHLGGFVQMCAGWNVLVEIGLRLGIDLDKPRRARKVGNEFTG